MQLAEKTLLVIINLRTQIGVCQKNVKCIKTYYMSKKFDFQNFQNHRKGPWKCAKYDNESYCIDLL
jgi:hypothetical protein